MSPVVDVFVTGLILLRRLSNLWDCLHFCMEKEGKIACVCDKLIELMVLFCLGLWLDLRKAQILFAIWSVHYSVALKQASSTPPQYPTSRPD